MRVLSSLEIPVLGELQGRNGIGKSLTIKLVQLLTGDQPWTGEDEAWQTLRERLGPTSVTVSGLAGETTIEWDLVPAAWPTRPPADIGALCAPAEGGSGMEMRINGTAADLDDVRHVLRVHRLVGDETLEDSVRARIDNMARRAQNETAAVRSASDGVRAVLAEAIGALEPLSGRVVRSLTKRRDDLQKQHERLVDDASKAKKRAARLLSLETRSRALEQLKEVEADKAAGELRAELERIGAHLKALRQERDQSFDAAVADVQLRQQIQDARTEVERVEALLQRAQDDARKQAASAGLTADMKDLDSEAVTVAHDSLVTEIRRLRETQVAQDAVPLVRQAAGSVKRTLSRVDPQSLLHHPFAVLKGEEVTGRELADGIDLELTRLTQTARDPTGEQLDREIAAATQRLAAIVELQRALARQRRHTSALSNRRAELLKLSGSADVDSSEHYVDLQRRIDELEDKRRELQGDHFRYEILLEELAPGEDLERAAARLARDLLAAGVVVTEDLAETRAAVEAALRELDYEIRQTEAALDETKRDLTSAVERRHLSGETLRHTALVAAMHDDGSALEADVTETEAEELLRAVERVMDGMSRLVLEADGVTGAFGQIHKPRDGQADRSRVDRVRTAAETEIVAALNQPVLRQELFAAGAVEGYDHLRKVVTFRPEDAPAAVTRSLSAFSSGERVFAYTQMRLRAIPETELPCENRVVVLDEFGAFLESRRIRALERLVEDELLGRGIDRVLFILPLTTNAKVNDKGFSLVDRSTV